MRVALITNNLLPPREGIGRHVIELAKRLPAHGIRPIVLGRGNGDGGWQRGIVEGVDVRLVPWSGLPPFHHAFAKRQLERWLADGADYVGLLHVHLPLVPPLATSLRTVVTVHSPMVTDNAAIKEGGLRPIAMRANARLFSRAYEQAWLNHAETVIAVSDGVRDELRHHYSLGGREPLVLPNAVDAGFFAAGPDANREKLILYVGRLSWRKGLDRLLAAFAQLERPDHRLVLIGEGPRQQHLQASAIELGIADRVTFMGFGPPEMVRSWMKRAAVLVNPADYESGPLTVLEAMAAGTPVVSTATGLVAELGAAPPLLVSGFSTPDLAARLDELLADPAAARARAAAACDLVRTRFAWDDVVASLAACYRRAARLAA